MTSLPCVQRGRDSFYRVEKGRRFASSVYPGLNRKRNGPGEKRLVNRAVSVCLA